MVRQQQHTLAVSLPRDPVWLDADFTRLAQVFANLLNNAATYSEPGGRIELSAERAGPELIVTVRDYGIGIPSDMLPRVFDMFTQGDRSVAGSRRGLGIGLSLVKRLVELHGGTVVAGSEGAGKGSVFLVRLPIVDRAPATANPLSADPQPRHGATSSGHPTGSETVAPHRVLVVDDNREAADTLATILDMTGNTTRTAYDGFEAVGAANDFRPDIVLLDIGLPGLSGYQVAERIRAEPWGNGTVLIAITGWGQADDRRRSRAAGFDHHLVKPVDPEGLMQLLARIPATEASA